MTADTDARARQRALDPTTSFHVQAPAGSGKTELLVQRLLALLATVDRPDAVLAITFTRKAAGEMRERVAEALGPLRAQPFESLEPHRRTTRRLADELYAHAERCGWLLPAALENLAIMTLDALHRRLAERAPLVSRLGSGVATLSGPPAKEVYRAAARELLARLPARDGDSDVLATVLAHFDNDVDAWLRGMTLLLERREQWLPLVGVVAAEEMAAFRSVLEDALHDFIETRLSACAAMLDGADAVEASEIIAAAAPALAELAGKERLHALAALGAMPLADTSQLTAWQGLADLVLTDADTVRRTVNVRNGFGPDDKPLRERMLALLARLDEQPAFVEALIEIRHLPPAEFADEQWRATAALLQTLPHLVAELQVAFQEQGLADYPELARAGRAALEAGGEYGDLALALDLSLRHILIDEMQDTSVSQYALLEALTAGWERGDGRSVFVVGDPMQSIYRFREADVGRFVRLRDEGLPSVGFESLVLTRNFRAAPALVDWCNQTFARTFATADDAWTGAVRFQPSAAARSADATAAVAVHALVDGTDEEEAQCTADIIVGELAAGSDDIAVLARARGHLDALTRVLSTRGIAYTAVEIEPLISTRTGAALRALTSAMLHDADRLSWLAVLRLPPVGLSLAELAELTRNERYKTVRQLLADPQRRAALPADRLTIIDRWLAALAATRADSRASLAARVERLWLELDGPDWLADSDDVLHAETFFDALRTFVAPGELPDPTVLTERLADVRTSRFGSGEARVQLLTMHKSKGLEFDTVILPGLGRLAGSDSPPPLSWLELTPDRREAVLLALAEERSNRTRDPHHAFVGRIGRQQALNERKRLLYVACTRAKRRLHLVGATALNRAGMPSSRSLLHDLWATVGETYRDAAAEAPRTANEIAKAERRPSAMRATATARRATPQKIAMSAESALVAAPAAVEYSWAGTTARVVGTVVHRWLESLAAVSNAATAADWYRQQAGRVRGDLLTAGLRDGDLDDAVKRCNEAVVAALGDERGRWLLYGPHRRSSAELALSGVIDGVVRDIVIDRAFETTDGEHWVVDYKTSEHKGGDVDAFIAAEIDRYREQLATYRTIYAAFAGTIPRTALYYPLLRRFVEIDSETAVEA